MRRSIEKCLMMEAAGLDFLFMNDELFSECHILFDCAFEVYGLIIFLVVVKNYISFSLQVSMYRRVLILDFGYIMYLSNLSLNRFSHQLFNTPPLQPQELVPPFRRLRKVRPVHWIENGRHSRRIDSLPGEITCRLSRLPPAQRLLCINSLLYSPLFSRLRHEHSQ